MRPAPGSNKHRSKEGSSPAPSDDPYAVASARTEERSKFFGHLAVLFAVVAFLAFAADFEAAMTCGLLWSIFIARRAYRVLVAPKLERRWLAEELEFQRTKRALALEQSGGGALAAARGKAQGSKGVEILSASIAHEIRNPITAAKSLVQQMGEDPNAAENVEYARVAIEELDRVERSISHLLRFAKEEPMAVERVELRGVIESALESFRDRVARQGVEVIESHDETVTLSADSEKLRRILINLIGNALEALDGQTGRRPELRVSSGLNLARTQAWVSVRDNGPGIEAERVERIFSPFHTSKRNGTGLGLAIAKKLAEAHGGTLEVQTEAGRFTEMLLFLPTRAGDDAPGLALARPSGTEASPARDFELESGATSSADPDLSTHSSSPWMSGVKP